MHRFLVSLVGVAASLVRAAQPNILFVFTDDQDIELGSMAYLNTVTSRIQGEGFTFNQHYTTVALCCPARAALLRGQHAHNTNITDVSLPGGSFAKFQASGEDADNLPHYLNRAGYRTEYIGKIMNGYANWNYATPPAGWHRFDGMIDPYMYTYNTPVFSVDGATPRFYNGSYLQDVVRAKAVARVEALTATTADNDAAGASRPWFLMVAPTAPHQTFNATGQFPPVPAARHAGLFPDVTAPRTPNFNHPPAAAAGAADAAAAAAGNASKKPSWVGKLPPMNQRTIDRVDETARARAQTLQSVDEMVAHLLEVLEEKGQLENTVVVYSSDHGYHLGQHRVPCGKTLPYKEDTHVPFLMRGPGIPKGLDTNLPSSHIDIAPTLLDLAGVHKSDWPSWLDGRSLLPYFNASSATSSSSGLDVNYVETVNVEYWGNGIIETRGQGLGYDNTSTANNTYKTARIISKDYSYMYAVWCTGETELYDTVADPYELSPIAANSSPQAARLTSRLNGLMLLLKTCLGDACRAPWTVLHPDGAVKTLAEALDPRHDLYYASLPSVRYEACAAQYRLDNEAPFFSSNYSAALAALTTPHRDAADYGAGTAGAATQTIAWDGVANGAVYEDLERMEARARDLTPDEIDGSSVAVKFRYK